MRTKYFGMGWGLCVLIVFAIMALFMFSPGKPDSPVPKSDYGMTASQSIDVDATVSTESEHQAPAEMAEVQNPTISAPLKSAAMSSPPLNAPPQLANIHSESSLIETGQRCRSTRTYAIGASDAEIRVWCSQS